MDNAIKEEARMIAEEYEPSPATDIDKLRVLDRKAKLPATIFAYSFGIVGALVLGLGLCLAMKVIGDLMPLGIVIGVVGIAAVCVNYPVYRAILRKSRKKYAEAIMSLSSRILNE